MVELNNVCKFYPTRKGKREILHDVSFTLKRGEKLGIMGCNGAGKSTLIRIIGKAEGASSGTVKHSMRVSWPLALLGGFSGGMTGADNLRFICRVYDVDYQQAKEHVEDFSELGTYFYEPVSSYSAGMRARLSFAISFAVDFDCYLIDEISAVGDKRFNDRCKQLLFDKTNDRSIVMVSHFYGVLNEYCNRFAVLDQGRFLDFKETKAAMDYYDEVLARQNITF